jgi:hypothetical protein
VEPAPEIVAEALVLELVELVVELLELELPHAARPTASIAQPASAPNLFWITTSPLAGLSLTARLRAFRLSGPTQRESVQPPAGSM